ncbi:hypothetical protein ACFC8N_45815 [Streptomyces sp. NPDC055966]
MSSAELRLLQLLDAPSLKAVAGVEPASVGDPLPEWEADERGRSHLL